MEKWLEFIRGIIRPFIAITGWSSFLVVTVYAILKYLDSELAKSLSAGFITAVVAIVGVWIGSRSPKK